ncbi:MAG TPA: thiamine-phosphate kinase [Steroidobacteraceae bacterium]|nr:thiamine-phosphate kinase [Steroidobacteraceae bacterium]
MAGAPTARDGEIPGEFALIDRYFTRPAAASGAGGVVAGIGDDAAVLRLPAGMDLIAAVDTLVEGRHFPAGSEPRSIGHRALAVNLSDVAAMGATPAWATLALTLPQADPAWLEGFSAGLFELAQRHGVALVGGDTTAGPLAVSVQILGFVPRGAALLRRGARSGDLIAVTGTLGDAAAGLALLQAPPASIGAQARELRARFEYPSPRVEFGLAARGIATAAIDLSDGLAGDLAKFAGASALAAHVELDRLPISAALHAYAAPAQVLDWALSGGDDYELLLAVAPERVADLAAAAAGCATPFAVIGEFGGGGGVAWTSGGRPFEPARGGFDHFARPSTQFTV